MGKTFHIVIFFIVVIAVWWMYAILKGRDSKVEEYINSSTSIQLGKIDYLELQTVTMLNSRNQYLLYDSKTNKYYVLEYYKQERYDYNSPLAHIKSDSIKILVNKEDLNRYGYDKRHPVHVLNYSVTKDDDWALDDNSYRYNVKKYLRYAQGDYYLHQSENFIWFIGKIVIGLLLLFLIVIWMRKGK